MSGIFCKISSKVSKHNSLIVTIKIKTTVPGIAYVKYSNVNAGKFVSAATSVHSTKNIVHLVRLRASTVYKYRVYLISLSGQKYISEDKYFITGSLPKNITESLNFSMIGHFTKKYLVVLCVNGIIATPEFFQGYIAVDFAGEIVWYYQAPHQMINPDSKSFKDRTLPHQMITPVSGDFFQLASGNFLITKGATLGTPVTLAQIHQAAQMQIINGLGELLYQEPLVCSTNPENIGTKFSTIANFGWTHASWQDPAKKNVIMNLGLQLRDPYYDAGIEPAGTRMQLGETIREWIPETGEQQTITSAFNLLDPITYRGTLSNDDYGVPINCDGSEPGLDNQDWTHGNAISRLNADSNWIISQRNTSSVLILEPETFKLLLKFGVTKPSDLQFINDNDRFYNQHDAHQLDNNNILMFDDGTSRPESEGGSYARAIEYRLDLYQKSIYKVWEFRPKMNLKCENNGSARRLDNGHTIVDFGATNLDVKHIYETCTKSNTYVADLAVSTKMSNIEFTIFRAVPIKSIFGEVLVC
jgi:hypothetical protein